MKDTPLRDSPITTRFRETDRDFVIIAARKSGVTVSEFVRTAVVSSAAQILSPRTGPVA